MTDELAENAQSPNVAGSTRGSVQDLFRQYGEEAVRAEGYRVFVEVLFDYGSAVTGAIQTDETSAFRGLPREALAGLAILADITSERELTAFLDRATTPDSTRPVITDLWRLTRDARESIKRHAVQILGSFGWDDALTDASFSALSSALAQRHPTLHQSDSRRLATYEPLLASLQHAFSANSSITDQLQGAVRDPNFREFLDRLVAVHEGDQSTAEAPIVDAANRYSVVLRCWHDLRLANAGRVNHWVTIAHDHYIDADTGYPQVEIRTFTYSRQLFHIKDDVDDILAMAVRMVGLCADSAEKYTEMIGSLPDDLSTTLLSSLSRLEGHLHQLRQLTDQKVDKEL